MQNQKQIKKGRSNDKERVKKDLIRFTKKVNSMVVVFFEAEYVLLVCRSDSVVHPGLQTFLVHFKTGQFYKENVSLFPHSKLLV